jgi:hypothetical protein
MPPKFIMAQQVQEVRIFVASPSDVKHLRTITFDEIEEVTHLLESGGDPVRAKRVAWEDLSPGVGEDGQDVINRQVGDNFDIFVGLLWHRFGTQTNRADSGTEEEFLRALDIHRKRPNRIRILTYRCASGPEHLANVDTDQLKKLNDFVKRLTEAGVLYHEFTDVEEFRKHLRRDLHKALRTFGTVWGVEQSVTARKLTGRLLELHDALGGPFRNCSVLRSLRTDLEATGNECLERLLTRSARELAETKIDKATIARIEEELANYGHTLRPHEMPIDPLDQLVLTPGCRNAVRQAGINSPEELSSRTWNDLMRSRYFVPEWVEEISLRLQQELGMNLRERGETPLTYSEVLSQQ